jgi:co-chaperonin GroES (HSP10)
MLTVVPEAIEEYADSDVGIVKSSQSMYYEEVLTPVLFVVKVGPDCYNDATRFPNGASCKVGDFVIVRPNSGTRLKIHGREFRLIADTSVEAVVEDPRGITRAA